MKLYLLRHGIAEALSATRFPEDSMRPLTREGMKKIRRIAKALRKQEDGIDVVLTSPYLRALQTAEIVAKVLGMSKKLQLAGELAPDGSPKALITLINKSYSNCKTVLAVGHEPYLSQLASTLLTGTSRLPIQLKKGGFCRLSIDVLQYDTCAVLELLASPKLLLRSH